MTRRLVLLQLGATGLVLAGALSWAEGVRGYELARAVGEAGGDIDGLPPAWLGWAWFLIPLLGFVAWFALWLPRVPPRRLHVVLGALGALSTVAFLVAARATGGSIGAGPLLALLASALLIAGGLRRTETQTTPTTF
jgi:hypothetical protein